MKIEPVRYRKHGRPRLLDIQPVIQLQHQRPLLWHKVSRKIVVGIHQEEIRNRCISPLQSGVDIDVVDLIIVLDKSCPKHFFGKSQIYSRPD